LPDHSAIDARLACLLRAGRSAEWTAGFSRVGDFGGIWFALGATMSVLGAAERRSVWRAATGRTPGGYRSGSAWVSRTSRTALAVGPTGSDMSVDGGRSWTSFDGGSFDSVECARDGACWASGEQGRVARLGFIGP